MSIDAELLFSLNAERVTETTSIGHGETTVYPHS